jgi:hypothetical protein
MVKTILVNKIMSDDDIAAKEGEHFDAKHYTTILQNDADVYAKTSKGKRGKLLLKFRKNVIPKEYTDAALESYRTASKAKHENRGASAGVLDRNKLPNYIGDFVNKGKFRTNFISNHSGKKSKQATSNLAPSNIIGFYDKADRNLLGKGAPCRLTAYNRDHPELWDKSLPFLKSVDHQFKKLTPGAYKKQHNQCQQVPEFAIGDTAFSTVTLNYSWRTALHRDAGDFIDGFGNLMVIEDTANPNTYKGSYTGFPQYGVAVDVKTGDFLAMDVHEWHSNTEFIPTNTKMAGGGKAPDYKNDWHFNRLSVVCYLRDKMVRCKNMKTTAPQLLNISKQAGGYYRSTYNNPKFNQLESLRLQIDQCLPGYIDLIQNQGHNLFD